ncbi:MAG: hypothetical protein Q8P60_14970 [Pseudorhodobacter sp.]|nr:hypothetical protein [Pseudorhodobacter sp.]
MAEPETKPQPCRSAPITEVTLAAKLDFLRQQFADAPPIETHTAFVFLTPDRALKLKKPVNLGYLDFRNLTARAQACHEELRLNRQLAGPDVYLGLLPLVLDRMGRLALAPEGQPRHDGSVVDWLIQMRRLPAGRMLDEMLRRGEAPERDEIAALFKQLAGFYRARQADPRNEGLCLRHLRQESAVNARHLHQMRAHLGDSGSGKVASMAEALILRHGAEISQRDKARLIVEGHGDLRPEHVCLITPPVVYDRIEFSIEMRMIDIFDEVNYLGLECAALGAQWIGPVGLAAMRKVGFAPPSVGLQTAYGVFRCVTRARLAIDHLRDPAPRTPEKWPAQAQAYLALAAKLLKTPPPRP